jgi:cell division protein FtsQ
MPVRAPADKRFKRARVQPPRKKRSWRAWSVSVGKGLIFVIVLAYATTRGVYLLTSTSALRIERLSVHGIRQLSNRDVQRLLGAGRAGSLQGSNILLADLDGWRARLLRSPWIKDAALRRVLPSTIEITIVEREPLGIGRLNDRLYLVSGDGVIIDDYSARYAAFDLPIIDGLHTPANANGLLVDEARSAFAADVLQDLRRSSDLATRVSQVDVSNDEDAVVLLADDPARVHLGREAYADRLRAYLNLAPTLRARVSGIDYVDLRFDPRIFVRPLGKASLTPALAPAARSSSTGNRRARGRAR